MASKYLSIEVFVSDHLFFVRLTLMSGMDCKKYDLNLELFNYTMNLCYSHSVSRISVSSVLERKVQSYVLISS